MTTARAKAYLTWDRDKLVARIAELEGEASGTVTTRRLAAETLRIAERQGELLEVLRALVEPCGMYCPYCGHEWEANTHSGICRLARAIDVLHRLEDGRQLKP